MSGDGHTNETREIVATPGVQADPVNGDLILTTYDHGSDDHSPLAVIRIPSSGIATFLRDVVNQGTYALAGAIVSIAAGDCETCRNTGMVNEEKNGRPWRVHCPDCGPRKSSEQVLDEAPRIRPSGFR